LNVVKVCCHFLALMAGDLQWIADASPSARRDPHPSRKATAKRVPFRPRDLWIRPAARPLSKVSWQLERIAERRRLSGSISVTHWRSTDPPGSRYRWARG